MKKKILILLNVVFLAATLAINYASNTGVIGGNTMKSVSDRYHNLFTPAPYAFSIWALIYLLLIGFVIYGFRFFNQKDEQWNFSAVSIRFILSCIANSLWVYAWLNDYIALSLLLMVFLLIALLSIINTINEIRNRSFATRIFFIWPFSIYAGWVTVALIANAAALLTKLEWSAWGISEVAWTVIMITIAALINILVAVKRNLTAFSLAGIWALIAVAVANRTDHKIVFITAVIAASLIAIGSILKHLQFLRRSVKTISQN